MKINSDSVLSFGLFGLGLVAIGYAFGVHSKMKTVCEKLDTSIDRLSSDADIEIPQKIIDQAVQRAVEREAYTAVKRAADSIEDKIYRDISHRVETTVDAEYDKIVSSVSTEISDEISKIDGTRIKRDIVDKAKEQIAEKFDDKLDGVLEEFNGNLQNVSKIYKSIAKSFSKEDI